MPTQEITRGPRRRIRDNDRKFEALGLGLEPRRDVHVIADGGIIEALFRAHIADKGLAGVDADADRDARRGVLATFCGRGETCDAARGRA